MDKKMVFEHYCNLLDDLREQSLAFQNFLIHNDTDEDWEFENAEVACGATRAALIDTQNDYPYIVKWDIDYDEWGDSSSAREVEIYKEAKYCGLASYFTEAVYLGEYRRIVRAHSIDGDYTELSDEEFLDAAEPEEREFEISIQLYGYERAQCDVRYAEKGSPAQQDYINKCNSPLTQRNKQVGLWFFMQYGEDVFNRLTDFCTAFSINDLHMGNVGLIGDNVVITDFGSYHCDD